MGCCPGGRLQPVLMRPTPQLSFKTRGGEVQPGSGGGGSSRGSGGGVFLPGVGGGVWPGGHGGVQPGVRGGGVRVRVKVRVRVSPRVRVRVRVRARVRSRVVVAVRACSPPVALLPCCFNTNMISLQNFEYFEYKHLV